MNEIFNLERYKEHLVSVYHYKMDNNEVSKNKRIQNLKNHYGDECLQRIINDTQAFIIYLLENNLTNETHICDIDLLEDPDYIFLNLVGGWFSDTLYKLNINGDDKIISRYLLKKFLDKKFRIEEDSRCETSLDEDDYYAIYSEYFYPFIRIIGDFQKEHEKLEELKKQKHEELVLILKRNIEKNK